MSQVQSSSAANRPAAKPAPADGDGDGQPTIHVEERFLNFDLTSAYTASLVLAALALLTLVLMQRLKPRESF